MKAATAPVAYSKQSHIVWLNFSPEAVAGVEEAAGDVISSLCSVSSAPVHLLGPLLSDAVAQQAVDRLDDPLMLLLREGAEVMRSEEHTSELQSRQYLVCR